MCGKDEKMGRSAGKREEIAPLGPAAGVPDGEGRFDGGGSQGYGALCGGGPRLRCRSADVAALLALTRALYGCGGEFSPSDGGFSGPCGETLPGGMALSDNSASGGAALSADSGSSVSGGAVSGSSVSGGEGSTYTNRCADPPAPGAAAEAVIRQARCFGPYWLTLTELTGALCRPVTGLAPRITAAGLCELLRRLGAEVM